ncbi:EEF1A lysine methyltransferase 1 [Podila epigama]|nr:EEF1A lysine methyltransferase 1 [Podila epigama]
MSDYDSDDYELSEETRAVLMQVMNHMQNKRAQFEALQRKEAAESSDEEDLGDVDMDLFTENWQLSQFWYNDDTAKALAQESLDNTKDGAIIACISSPSAFLALRKMELPKNTKIYVLEFDTRFDVFGKQFVLYDYNIPTRFSKAEELKGKVDYIIADPPFLSDECMNKTMQTVKFLLKEDGKAIYCTGLKMRLLIETYNFHMTTFEPKHKGGLSNEFKSYTNYDSKAFPRAPAA